MRAKPTLGFPSRTDAVMALRAAGKETSEIASQLGVSPATVSALEHSGGRRRSEPRVPVRTVLFPTRLLAALGPHAARRSIRPNSLARLIVECVVEDDLVDAVLDDTQQPEQAS